VDVSAHGGGLVGGLLLGYAFLPSLNKHSDRKLKYLSLAGVSAAVLLLAVVFFALMG
jgi:rhomboid protease GluP